MSILLHRQIRFFGILLLSCTAFMGSAIGKTVKSTPMVDLPSYSYHVHAIKNRALQKKAKQAEFKQLVERLRKTYSANQLSLPEKTHKNIIRLATYNVHCWRSPEKGIGDRVGSSFADIINVIIGIDADILIMQEVELRSIQTVAVLSSLGYKYKAFVGGSHPRSKFGNMIVSKLPFSVDPVKKNFSYGGENHARALVKIEIDLSTFGKKNLVIYGTHFDDQSGKLRLLEAQELADNAQQYDLGKNVIIGADFNEYAGSAIKHLASKGFINSFDLAGIDQPRFTHWSAKAIDGLHVQRKNWDLWVDGSYIVYSGASDHLPVVMDIDPTKK